MKKILRKTGLFVVVGALAACALVGCGQSDQSSNSSNKDLPALSVSYLNKASYEDIIVGDHEGDFKDAGCEITLYTVSGSGQQSVEAMLAGTSDVAATGQGPVADAIKQYGDDIVILAGSNCSTGGQVWVAGPQMTGNKAIVPYDADSKNNAEVKASFESAAAALGGTVKIGVQQGATTESDLKSWLKMMDISFNDFGTTGSGIVTLVDVKANTLPTVLASGTDIDIMAASQPYPDTALKEIEGSYKIGSNADTGSYTVTCFITTKKVFEEKEDSIKAFLKADQKACDFMNSNPDEAVKICTDSEGADEASVQAAFDIADFNVALTDQMIDTIQKTCAKKGVDITIDQLKQQMPLLDWLNGGMK